MKEVFLVHISLPEVFTPTFYKLIPKHRLLINELLEKRTILSYALDMERRNVWLYIEAVSEQQVMDVLSTFPIISHVKINIHELAFFDRAPVGLPDLIMN